MPHSVPWDASGESKPDAKTGQIDPQNHNVHKGLPKSHDPQLRKLAQYEKQYDYGFAGNITRVGMPRNRDEAQKQSADMVKRLQEYKRQGIQPVVFFEARQEGGHETPLDLKKLNDHKHTKEYKIVMDEYFANIAQSGITDQEMGVWMPLPTPNNSGGKKDGVVDPAIFKRNAVPVMQAIKTHFNNAEVGITLDSAHPTLKYVDVVGFHYYPNNAIDNAAEHSLAQTAMQTASRVGAKKIMLDTGTASAYRQHNGSMESASVAERGAQLAGVFTQAQETIKAGYDTFINIAVENDANSGGSNWSYAGPNETGLMKLGLQDAAQAGIPVTFYDGHF
jgi:hypothetical protein